MLHLFIKMEYHQLFYSNTISFFKYYCISQLKHSISSHFNLRDECFFYKQICVMSTVNSYNHVIKLLSIIYSQTDQTAQHKMVKT